MQLRADIQLRAAIKALTDTIAPAVDPENKLAIEQLQMVIGALTIVEQNLPLQFRFDRNELHRLLALANSIAGAAAEGKQETIVSAVKRAADAGALVLDRAKADSEEVLHAVRDLRAECGAATTALVRGGGSAAQRAVTETVLAYSREQTLRDRSWLMSLGFESPQADIPPIRELLAGDEARFETSR